MANRLTGFSAAELEAFFLLLVRIFSDYRSPDRGHFGLVYPFCQTTDNEGSNFHKVVELTRKGAMRQLGICRGSTELGYAGFEHSLAQLKVCGLDQNMVTVRPINVSGKINTLTEAEELLRHCENVPGDIGIIAPAFHLVRVFVTMVSVMRRTNEIRPVYPIVGEPLDWTMHVRHSQGVLKNTRAGLIADELTRLEKYRAPEYGNMLGAEEVLAYLDWRDNA